MFGRGIKIRDFLGFAPPKRGVEIAIAKKNIMEMWWDAMDYIVYSNQQQCNVGPPVDS